MVNVGSLSAPWATPHEAVSGFTPLSADRDVRGYVGYAKWPPI